MYKTLFLALLSGSIWLGWGHLSASACELLPAAVLSGATATDASLRQSSQIPERCSYSWHKVHWQEIEAQNKQALLTSMQMGQPAYTPISPWARVEAEILFQAKDETAAQAQFQRYVQHRQAKTYGSPDPLAEAAWQKVALTDGDAVWSKAEHRLLLRRANVLVVLRVQVKDTPKDDLALALQLARGLSL